MLLTPWRKSSFSSDSDSNCVEVAWRKSSFSAQSDGDCVEVAWRKSSFSAESDGDCVEIAFAATAVAVRDSKNTSGPMLTFDPATWYAFTALRR